MTSRHFASDNHAGVHPQVLAAMAAVNHGHAHSYGADDHTLQTEARLRDMLGAAAVFFVFNGTAANALSAAAACQPHHAVICADTAHFHHDECGATERFAGCRVLPVPAAADGKLSPEALDAIPTGHAEPHQNVPRLLSITQATELGTVYTPPEINAVAAAAHDRGLLLHMDGARLANAGAHLDLPLRAFTGDAGVDVLSLGLTKNGAMLAEAVVLFRPELAAAFPYIRKQGLQLASKMRFVSAQFQAMLDDDLYSANARHANRMARLLAAQVGAVPGVQLLQPVEANAVFAQIPAWSVAPLRAEHFFYVWDEGRSHVRWMTAFDTTEEDVQQFAAAVRRVLTTGSAECGSS